MTMPVKFKPFLFQLLYIIICLPVVGFLSAFIGRGTTIGNALSSFALLTVGYLFLAFRLKKGPELRSYWAPGKIYWLLVGGIAGIIIQAIPFVCVWHGEWTIEKFWDIFSATEYLWVGITFIIVFWEELWFRNPVLNLAKTKKERIIFSLYTGFLFAGLHVMNPKINLLVEGPELFLAGTMLTMAYYASRSFYLPLGLHFGNNFFASLVEKSGFGDVYVNGGHATETMIRCFVILVSIALLILLWPKDKSPILINVESDYIAE